MNNSILVILWPILGLCSIPLVAETGPNKPITMTQTVSFAIGGPLALGMTVVFILIKKGNNECVANCGD